MILMLLWIFMIVTFLMAVVEARPRAVPPGLIRPEPPIPPLPGKPPLLCFRCNQRERVLGKGLCSSCIEERERLG